MKTTNLPSIRLGQPVLLGSTVGHASSFKRGEWTGSAYVEESGKARYWTMHRDSVTVLQGPALPPAMLKALSTRAVLGK